VDRHLFWADQFGSDLFHLDAHLDPDLDHMLENLNFFSFIHRNASLHCVIFLVSVKGVRIFSILEYRIIKFSRKRIVYLNIWLKFIRYGSGSGKIRVSDPEPYPDPH